MNAAAPARIRTMRTLRIWCRMVLWCSVAASVATSTHAQTTRPAISKKCESARKKIDREQTTLTGTLDGIARDRKARESCVAKSACARYDSALTAGEKRKARHELRLARFREEVSAACGIR